MQIYLDNSATTRPYPEVVAAVAANLAQSWGNPSGIYFAGRAAYARLAQARAAVAALIGADEREIYFTSGGTEADNLALRGVAGRFAAGHIITTAIEHAAVLNTCRDLEKQGYAVTYIQPDKRGVVNADEVLAALRPNTLLVSVMLANNEVGTIQPVRQLGQALRGRGVLLHTDAVQAVGKILVDVDDLGVDMLTLSAHKLNGPKGAGALYVRHGVDIAPVQTGGGQELGLRSGTENVPGIVGFGRAAELTRLRFAEQRERTYIARAAFLDELGGLVDGWQINGAFDDNPENSGDFDDNPGDFGDMRLPGNLHLSFAGVDGAALLLMLDMAGVAASAASACSAGSGEPSYVLRAMGAADWQLYSALRLTFGWENTPDEARQAARIVAEQVRWLRGHGEV